MKLENTEDEYGFLSRAFHWVIAFLIIGLIPVGFGMGMMENSPFKFEIYAMHKSFGLLVFFLGIARLVWRFFSSPPDHLETHAKWEVTLAGAAHFWLYVCIIGMPLTGWLMSSALEFPVPFFGYSLPWIVGKDTELGMLFGDAHEILAYTLLFVLALHAAGALKHHVLDKDATLQRMAYMKAGLGFVAFIVLVLGLSYGLSASVIVAKSLAKKDRVEQDMVVAATVSQPADLPDTSSLPDHGWAIIPSESNLTFTTTMYGTPFTGTFGDFNGEIIFNPDDLAASRANIRIGLDNVKTGDADRDSSIVGSDWFDAASNPDAVFRTMQIEHAEGNNYIAIGELTLRGVTMPLSLPFTLEISGDRAKMRGSATVNRMDFGMGGGQWDDEQTVGHDVEINVDLSVIR